MDFRQGGGLPKRKHFMGEEQSMIHNKGIWNDWKVEAEKALRGKSFESLMSMTYEGIALKPLYVAEDIIHQSSSYAYQDSNNWKICQLLLADECMELSEMIKHAKLRGQDSFYLNGFHFIKNTEDVEFAFEHIDWEADSIFFDVGEELGIIPLFLGNRLISNELRKVRGVIGFDPYEDLLVSGKTSVSLDTKFDYLADIMKWTEANECAVRCLLIKSSLYHDAGANSLQELIYTFSTVLDAINELLHRGVSIEVIAKHTQFSFSIGSNYFMEIAKLRAAKQIWASLINALGGSEAAQKINVHAITSTFNKTVYDAHVNLLRTSTEAFTAAVAGVDELTILPFDSVLERKGELGERISRNTHYILKEESLISKVVDPAAGSYYVEAITNELATKAWNGIQEIDENGGHLNILMKGIPQLECEKMLAQRRSDINSLLIKIIGSNAFANLSDHGTKPQKSNHKRAASQNAVQVGTFHEALLYIREKKDIPMIKPNKQTEQLQIPKINHQRLIEHFEQLRVNADTHYQISGKKPKVGVLTFGPLKDYKPRLDFVTGLLAAGGICVEVMPYNQQCPTHHVNTIIFCGRDEEYQLIDEKFIQKLKDVHLFIAGKKHEMKIDENRIEAFLSANMDAYQFLIKLHRLLGVKN